MRRGKSILKRLIAFVVSTMITYSILHCIGSDSGDDEVRSSDFDGVAVEGRQKIGISTLITHPGDDDFDVGNGRKRVVSSPSPPPTALDIIAASSSNNQQQQLWPHTTSMTRPPTKQEIEQGKGKFHVMLTANDAHYVAWQSRIMYRRYLKIISSGGDTGAFGGFTRVLHCEHPDNLMDEIPSVVVDPLPKGVDQGYVVLNRPFAIKQWLEKYYFAEEYVFMTEPDHLYLRPIPMLATPLQAAAFPFFYINPKDPKFTPIVQKFNKANAELKDFAPIGNSPVMIHKAQLKKVCTVWDTLAIEMKHDEEANAAFGWVLEMWAYSIASAQVGVKYELVTEFMLQPPWDKTENVKNGKQGYILHYTYGQDFNEQGRFTPGKVGAWHWDKRDFTWKKPPKEGFLMPPAGTHPLTVKLMEIINDGIKEHPNW